jgi:ATP-dependent Lon protease
MQQSLLRWRRSTIKFGKRCLKVLGVPRLERDKYESNDVGVVTGLAWTSGMVIFFIESLLRQERRMTITGTLVMKEPRQLL